MKQFLKQFFEERMSNIASFFCENELAYLAIEEKIERNLRDKLAWLLQNELDNKYGNGKYLVKVEWSQNGRSKCDIAVLKLNDTTNDFESVIAMIEMKDHSTQKDEPDYYNKILFDMNKMQNIKTKSIKVENAALFYIFCSHVHLEKIESTKPAFTYCSTINQVTPSNIETCLNTVDVFHKKILDKAMEELNLPNCSNNNYNFTNCYLGSYFNHDVHLASSIYML